jgi:hypothetical protein
VSREETIAHRGRARAECEAQARAELSLGPLVFEDARSAGRAVAKLRAVCIELRRVLGMMDAEVQSVGLQSCEGVEGGADSRLEFAELGRELRAWCDPILDRCV